MIGGRTCLWYRVIAALLRKPPIEPASVCTRLSAVLLSSMRILVAAQQVPSPPGACLPACALLPQVGRGRAAGVPAPCHAGVPAPCLRVVALASSLALATPLRGMGANASQVSSPVRALRRLAFGRRSCGRQGARSGAACGAWRPPRRRRRGRPGGSLEGVSAFATFCQRMDLRQSEKTRGKYLSHTASQNKSNTVLL